MKVNGALYTFARNYRDGGYEVYRNGVWVGWTAGNAEDCRNFARQIERGAA